jgi:dipeptidyl aminopeptidase/acylaminoacyl peptidase
MAGDLCPRLASLRTKEEAVIQKFFHRVEHHVARELRSRRQDHVIEQRSLTLRSSAGYRIAATLHVPEGPGPWPAVVLCPGSDHAGDVFLTRRSPITAIEVASLGCVVLTYDPSGRGQSWGPEDYGGPEHQDNAATGIRHLRTLSMVDANRTGLVGISLGIASAVGAAQLLARSSAPVAWVLDWEGPCDQRTITANQTRNEPAMGHRADDRSYWDSREAVRHVGEIGCAYLRLQASPDHAQPDELEHALAMLQAADSARLPWFRLNDHVENQIPATPTWLRGGPLAANRALLRAIDELIHR